MLLRETEYELFLRLAQNTGPEDTISMDHDLGLECPFNGYELLSKLESLVYEADLWKDGMPTIIVHSQNPVGKRNMQDCINAIKAQLEKFE